MDIDQEVEQLGPSVAIPGAGNVPTTTKRDAGAKVAVKSGQTIILGGFISASRSLAHSGVPWLMDIPVLGNLFKSSATQNGRTELIVLMRPTVLNNPEIAAKVAKEQRDTMAAVKEAEVDIRRDEDKRNAAAQKEMEAEAAAELKRTGHVVTNSDDEFHFLDTNHVNLQLTNAPGPTAPVPFPGSRSVFGQRALPCPGERQPSRLLRSASRRTLLVNRGAHAPSPAASSDFNPERIVLTQPRVARNELPWDAIRAHDIILRLPW